MKISLTLFEKFLVLSFSFFFIWGSVQLISVQSEFSDGWLYEELIEGIVVEDNLSYRTTTARTFRIDEINFNQADFLFDGENFSSVTYRKTDFSTGSQKLIQVPLKANNFHFKPKYNDGLLETMEFDIFMFRNPSSSFFPYHGDVERSFITSQLIGSGRLNENSSEALFKVEITFKVSRYIDGQLMNFTADTLLVANNVVADGRVLSSAVHTIIRDQSENIIAEFDHSIRELSFLQRQWLALNHPQFVFSFTIWLILLAAGIADRLIISTRNGGFSKFLKPGKGKVAKSESKVVGKSTSKASDKDGQTNTEVSENNSKEAVIDSDYKVKEETDKAEN